MPNAREHVLTGLITSGIVNAYEQWNKQQRIDIGELALSAISGGVGGLIVDRVEPASNPYHRSTFHSATALAACGYGYSKANSHPTMNEGLRVACKGFLIGCGSHIVLDSGTALGIPLIHKEIV